MFIKTGQHRAAHAAGGGVGQTLAGLALHAHQLVVFLVPFPVRNGGIVQRVILIGGFVQPIHQLAHVHCNLSYSLTLTIGAMLAEKTFSTLPSKATRTRCSSPAPMTSTTRPRPKER